MPHTLPDLPYDISALEPHISAQTLTFHHGKHHQAYVTNLNNLTQNTELADKSLEEIIHATAKNPEKIGIFNNAAQVWNHTFFWNCMKPQGGGQPMGDLKAMIEKGFGSYEAFAAEFKQAALTQFGSGWAWLVLEKGNLRIMKTANAPDYVDTFLAHLVNWDFAASLLNAA
ncbi:MAG: superoxide dismutase [Alphaproteobacteria bacterium]|nr:superoxide dismutase [Alphaproteobacteria bacterium]